MTTQPTIESLLEIIAKQSIQIDLLLKRVDQLEKELAVYKNKKNSNNSHIAPSKDENRPKKNQSLRQKSIKKPGGQPGHPGKTLEFTNDTSLIDQTIEHLPQHCENCGLGLGEVEKKLVDKRQVIDIPPIKPIRTEHQIFSKICTCGCVVKAKFPQNINSKVQYGPTLEATIAYLGTRQYMPYQRMQEFLSDVMNLPISQGTIANVLQRFSQKSMPFYQEIKNRIEASKYIGSDETGIKVDGKKYWGWTWQNRNLTFISITNNRGFKTIADLFGNGLPNSFLGHDRWAAHFKCDSRGHQLCTAHLLRDLNYIVELHQSPWAKSVKEILLESLNLKKELLPYQYLNPNSQREKLEQNLRKLLREEIPKDHKKAKTLQKQLLKYQDNILLFLHHLEIPPDNNGSERAIRNMKVKQKTSGQFKSVAGADAFAVIRSIIDTIIKSEQNIIETLQLIALTRG